MSEFSSNLSVLLNKRELTDREVAEAVGVKDVDVMKWRTGRVTPSLDQLIALSDYLGISVDELIGKVESGEIRSARLDTEDDDDDRDCDFECYVTEENGRRTWTWKKKNSDNFFVAFPFSMLCVIAYLVMGFVWGLWHPGWLIFLAIPLYRSLVENRLRDFPWVLFVTVIYLSIGLIWGLWHPWWIIYLSTPIFYFIVNTVEGVKKSRKAMKKLNEMKEKDKE